MPHPHQSLLDELKIAIDHLPPGFPQAERERARAEHAALVLNPTVTEGEIEVRAISLGRASWPYRKAYEAIHDRYGIEKEDAYFRDHLQATLRKKYEGFAVGLIGVHDVIRHKEFEYTFTPEEKFQIQEAIFEAHERVESDLAALIIGAHRGEYEAELAAWRAKQIEIARKIETLRALADRSPKWASEIVDKVRVFEVGWLPIERDPDLRIVEGEIDYYRNIIED